MNHLYALSQQQNPLRRLDWRWRRACQLYTQNRRFSLRQDDELTGETLRYLRKRARCNNERQWCRLTRQHWAVDQALRLHEAYEPAQPALQARLLAGQSPAEIGRTMGRSETVIETYAALFFDVRDRLQARTWILLEAIGRVEDAPTDAQRQERFVKLLAYHGGPVILDVVLRSLGSETESDHGDELESEQGLLSRRIKLLELLMSGPVPPEVAFEISEISRALDEAPPAPLETVFGRRASEYVRELFASGRILVVPHLPVAEAAPTTQKAGEAA